MGSSFLSLRLTGVDLGATDAPAFDLDVLACPRCGGRLRLIALLHDPRAIGALLAAASQPSDSPDRSPPI